MSITGIVDTMTSRLSAGKRRAYTADEKRRIVEETLKPGASVSVVARRHDVNANMVFTWRKRYRALPAPAMLPVEIAVTPSSAPAKGVTHKSRARAAPRGRIEIEMASGHRVQVVGVVDIVLLRQVIETLSR